MNGTYGDPNNSWDRFDLNIDDIDPEQLSREFLHNNNSGDDVVVGNNNAPLRQLGSRQNSGFSIDDPSGDFLANMSRDLGFGASGTSFAAAAEMAAQQPTPAELQQQVKIDMEPAPLRQVPPPESSSTSQPAPQHVASKNKPAAVGAGEPPGDGDALILKGRNIQGKHQESGTVLTR